VCLSRLQYVRGCGRGAVRVADSLSEPRATRCRSLRVTRWPIAFCSRSPLISSRHSCCCWPRLQLRRPLRYLADWMCWNVSRTFKAAVIESVSFLFFPRCMESQRGLAMRKVFVCLSVCPSVGICVKWREYLGATLWRDNLLHYNVCTVHYLLTYLLTMTLHELEGLSAVKLAEMHLNSKYTSTHLTIRKAACYIPSVVSVCMTVRW